MLQWLVVTILALLPTAAKGHGRMMDPPARNSMWRLGFANPVNYNDNELYCGGRMTQWARNNGKCGVCGDPYHKPREHETGGKYANGIITRDYVEGDVITVSVLITANHQGYFEFRICPVENPKVEVTQACLDKHVLKLESGEGTRFPLSKGKSNHFFNYSVRLPRGLICKHCVIQWKYRTGNTWDKDPSGNFCVGCGPQEEFYNCADVAVHRNKIPSKTSEKKQKRTDNTAAVTAAKTPGQAKSESPFQSPYMKAPLEAYSAKNIPGASGSWSVHRNSLSKGVRAMRKGMFANKVKKAKEIAPPKASKSPFSPPPRIASRRRIIRPSVSPFKQRLAVKAEIPTKVPGRQDTTLNNLGKVRMGKYHNIQSEIESSRNPWKQQRLHHLVSLKKSQKSSSNSTPVPSFSTKGSLTSSRPSRDQTGGKRHRVSLHTSLDNPYSEEKKSYIHKRLPYWLIQALRMRANYNKKETNGRSKSTRNNFETMVSRNTDEDPLPQRKVIRPYHEQDEKFVLTPTSRVEYKPRKKHDGHERKSQVKKDEKRSHFDESQLDSKSTEIENVLSSSEEESLIRKIVQLILERRKSHKTSKHEEGHYVKAEEDSHERKSPAARNNRYSHKSNTISVPSPTTIHGIHNDEDSPVLSVFSSSRRNFGGTPGKLSTYFDRTGKHESFNQRLGFNDPKLRWLRGNTSGVKRDGFSQRQNELYMKGFERPGPDAVPYTNVRSLDRGNYGSLGEDISFSPTSNAPLHRAPISNNQAVGIQSQFEQQQKSRIMRQLNHLDKFAPDRFVQDPNFLWALKMQQRHQFQYQRKKPSLVCKGVVRLGGGMDQWCNDNCNANYCPASTCICKEQKPEMIPVIAPFASNPGGLISDVRGVTWVPFNAQNSYLSEAEDGPSVYYPETSVYSNRLPRNQRLNNMGYKIENVRNAQTNQRYPSAQNVLPYYTHQSRPVSSPLLGVPFASQGFSHGGIHNPTLRRNLSKSLRSRQGSRKFSRRRLGQNNLDLVMRQRRKRNQRASNGQSASFYGPKPSPRSRLMPVSDYYFDNDIIYRKQRGDLSQYGQGMSGPY